MNNVYAIVYPYCVVNTHDDILGLFRTSEFAQIACDELNKANVSSNFKVRMTSNVINGFKEFEKLSLEKI